YSTSSVIIVAAWPRGGLDRGPKHLKYKTFYALSGHQHKFLGSTDDRDGADCAPNSAAANHESVRRARNGRRASVRECPRLGRSALLRDPRQPLRSCALVDCR